MTQNSQPDEISYSALANSPAEVSTSTQNNLSQMKAYGTAFLILLILATSLFMPIFSQGFPDGVDSDRHFRWTLQFSEALKEPGVFYPRWLASANNQQGSPAALYYPPLTFYVAAIFNYFLSDGQKTLIWSFWLALFLSGATMFIFCRSLFSQNISLLASALYMLAPYHVLDLYQGSSVAEFWAFVWLPLVLHAIKRIAEQKNLPALIYLALTYAILLLTHLPITFALTLIIPVYVLALTRNWQTLLQIGSGFALGFGLSAFFLLPVSQERNYVHLDAVLRLEYNEFFLYKHIKRARQTPLFLHDLSAYEATTDGMKPPKFRYLIKTEQAALGLPILLLVSMALVWLNRKRLRDSGLPMKIIYASWLLAIMSLFLTTKYSLFLWQAIAQLAYMQFPSRWLVITTLAMSLATAAACLAYQLAGKRRLVYLLVLVIAIALNLIISFFSIYRAPYNRESFDAAVLRREAPEYRPIWWDRDLHEEELLPPFTVASGNADVQALDSEGIHQAYEVNARDEAVINFRPLYFPGWAAYLDGQPQAVTPSDEGHVQVKVEPGEHRLTLNFEDTGPRFWGKIISAISLVCVVTLMLFSRRKKISG